MAEFAAAIAILTLVILPLANLSLVPVRWLLMQEAVNTYARQLAFCETFSQCRDLMDSDLAIKEKLASFSGITVEHIKVQLRITRVAGAPGTVKEELVVDHPRQIPPAWLPTGNKAPCLYSLELNVDSLISPAFQSAIGGHSIPGINAPIPILVTSSHEWSNLGRNPVTGKYSFNE